MRFIFCCFLALGILSGCNTMQGLGRDIESLGSGLDRTAGDTKEKL